VGKLKARQKVIFAIADQERWRSAGEGHADGEAKERHKDDVGDV
jgi:hypothetical protein